MPIRISSAVEGFRRAGIKHSVAPKVYLDDFFSAKQVEQLKAEPRLAVEFLSDEQLPAEAETTAADSTEGALDAGALDGVTDGHLDGGVEPAGSWKNLQEMKVDVLRQIAKDLEIEGYAGMKKAELVAAIQAVPVQIDPAGDGEADA